MKISPIVFVVSCLVSPWASADIFKCVDAKGIDKYQNFPCQIDSIGSKATAAPPKDEAVSPSVQAAAAPAALAPIRRQPVPGMRIAEVRTAWGVPKSTRVVRGVETWYYDGPAGTTRGVRFDRSGTVLEVVETVAKQEIADGADEALASE